MADRRGVVVTARGAVDDRTGPADRAAGREQGLDQRRLTRSGMPDEHHVAYPAGLVHHRRRAGDPFLLGLLRHRRTSLGSHFGKLNAALPSRCDPTPVWPAAQPRHAITSAPAKAERAGDAKVDAPWRRSSAGWAGPGWGGGWPPSPRRRLV